MGWIGVGIALFIGFALAPYVIAFTVATVIILVAFIKDVFHL